MVKLNAGLQQAAHLPGGGWDRPAPRDGHDHPGARRRSGVRLRGCRRGEPRIGFAELYFQTAYDPSVAPPGTHMMSVFAQYVPVRRSPRAIGSLAARRWASWILDAIAAYAPDVATASSTCRCSGPPDIERRIGLTGGHIFQGEALPNQMWDRRLDHRTPIGGLYLCGAATHPAGSVIALNGRNAAMAVLGTTRPDGSRRSPTS